MRRWTAASSAAAIALLRTPLRRPPRSRLWSWRTPLGPGGARRSRRALRLAMRTRRTPFARGGRLTRRPALRLAPPKMRLRLFRPRWNHRQRYATPCFVNFQHPHLHNVAHRNNLVRIADIAIGKLADMDQAAVVQADIDESAEINDVEH